MQSMLEFTWEFIGRATLGHGMIWKTVGAKSPSDAIENYEKYRALYQKYSPYNHLDKDDPPVVLYDDNIHSSLFGMKLKEKARKLGSKVYLCGEAVPQSELDKKDFPFRGRWESLISTLKESKD